MLDEGYRAVLFAPGLVNVHSADVPPELLEDVLAHPPPKLRRVALEGSASHRLDEQVRAVQRILAGAHFEEVAVSVPMGEDLRAYFRALLPLATEKTSVVVSTRTSDCRTTRSDAGLVLRVPKRDRRLLAAAREACPEATVV